MRTMTCGLIGIAAVWCSALTVCAAQRPQKAPPIAASVVEAKAQPPICPMQGSYKPAKGSLMTRWAKDVSPTNALNEYPRPQRVRSEWANLNGLWEYAIAEKDAKRPSKFDGMILVPFPIESALSGVMKTVGEANRLWCRRTFEVPGDWDGQRVLLHFGAVDWEATVWLNGVKLGEHKGGYDAFSFDITEALGDKKGGKHELIVSVWDPSDAGPYPRGKQVRKARSIWYTPTTGIWQTVWMEPVSRAYIDDVQIAPDVDNGTVAVGIKATAGAGETKVKVEILDGAEPIQAAEIAVVGARAWGATAPRIAMRVPNAKLWSPDSPFLYGLRITLETNGQVADVIESYFGMRKIAVAKDAKGVSRLMLNNQFVFQMGPLDQGFWPDGLYTAPTDDALRYDIEATKKLGFNMARKHVKVEPARWYYHCDRLGLLVWQDMPSGNTEGDRKQFAAELTRLVQSHYNSPCIVMWVVFNEGWGQMGGKDPADTKLHVDLVRKLDAGRLICNGSGWFDHGFGDVVDGHKYPGPNPPWAQGYSGKPEAKRASVLSEFGGLKLAIEGHMWPGKSWGYRGTDDREHLTRRYEELLAQVYQLKDTLGLSAAVYTQTTDVEIEANGLLTYDRAVFKPDVDRVAAVNRGDLSRVPLPPKIIPVVATSKGKGVEWRYTFQQPGKGWLKIAFDDSAWKKGPGGFGTKTTPGSVVRTVWDGKDIWLRREFTLPQGTYHDLQLLVHHDEDAEIYLNGVLACKLAEYRSDYGPAKIGKEARAALKIGGKNVLAVHCNQERGGQYIDVGLVDTVPQKKK